MRVVLFCHSLVSDWNHGNAHFLRGVCRELLRRGHEVDAWEPGDGWSRLNLIRDHGTRPLEEFAFVFPDLTTHTYRSHDIDLDEALDGADLVLVHEWTEPALIAAIGRHRVLGGRYALLFHDTHHRSVTAPDTMASFDLSEYDGVLAFGEAVRNVYLSRGWTRRAWTWHEAADMSVFAPAARCNEQVDVAWIGNWGDEERTAELHEFLLEPAQTLSLSGRAWGVRYPMRALRSLAESGFQYGGWLPNHRVPGAYAEARFTVHIPRRPYTSELAGIPTIRVFEALACGIPLVSAYWDDAEGLFTPGRDFLLVRDGAAMQKSMKCLLHEPEAARALAEHGRETILSRHTCAHRVDELLRIRSAIVDDAGDARSPALTAGAASSENAAASIMNVDCGAGLAASGGEPCGMV